MYYYDKSIQIESLLGKTITKIKKVNVDGDELHFHMQDGTIVKMLHQQDCCESVYIEDICGDLEDLIRSPIVRAEEPSSLDGFEDEPDDPNRDETHTWTFYILGTTKGTVTIRWYGSSNGYYSESVSLYQINPTKEN